MVAKVTEMPQTRHFLWSAMNTSAKKQKHLHHRIKNRILIR